MPGGPCRHGVAVIVTVGFVGCSSRVVLHGANPTESPPRYFAAFTVVTVMPQPGRRSRPVGSRLSPW